MIEYKKIIVVCPGNTVTGGPEAMHYLVHTLRRIGLNAKICYFPKNQKFATPDAYSDFDVTISDFEDINGNLIIFPETFPMDALRIKYAKAAIWWLSVDHFTGFKNETITRDIFNYIKLIIKGLRPIRGILSLHKIIHFSQSHYSSTWLSKAGLHYYEMYEPINQIYLQRAATATSEKRKNQILYNPSKGKKIVEALINRYPEFKFIALQKFNREELIDLYLSSKIYIDFGHHPGRDRIPREAAVLGCCLITGCKGSASNSIDIPTSDEYKIDSGCTNFVDLFGTLTQSIFMDFHRHFSAQKSYR